MRRLLIVLLVLTGLVATAVAAVPYVLPVDAIKAQVIAQVEKAAGWRLRLDGPVGISVVPHFSLWAKDVGISGEAGADGIEFAKAKTLKVDLEWLGLIGGDIRLNGVHLIEPELYLETAASGLTSWEPRRELTAVEEAEQALGIRKVESAPASTDTDTSAETAPQNAVTDDGIGALARIGVDNFTIEKGSVTYLDRPGEVRQEVRDLNVTLSAPSLTGTITLDSDFIWQGQPITIKGQTDNPLGLAQGQKSPLEAVVNVAGADLALDGDLALAPFQLVVTAKASGEKLEDVASAFGQTGPMPEGAFSLAANLQASDDALSLSDLKATLGSFTGEGFVEASLAEASKGITGRVLLREAPLADVLKLGGVPVSGSGQLAADVRFSADGLSAAEILGSLDAMGTVQVSQGELTNLPVSSSMNLPEAAKTVSNLQATVAFKGRQEPVSLNGSLKWLGDNFTIQGQSALAALAAGKPATMNLQVKSQPLTAGFGGTLSLEGALDGVVNVKTPDLRLLLARLGHPLDAGGGLRNFSVRGRFSQSGQSIAFKDTEFEIDEVSGTASGSIDYSGKPRLQGDFNFASLGLDPYFSSAEGASKDSKAGKSTTGSSKISGGSSNAGWSDAPLDFGALSVLDAKFRAKAQKISYGDILIDRGTLSVDLKNGDLTADLSDLGLYKGSGTAQFKVSSAGGTPRVSAKVDVSNVAAHPLLKDAADFDWLEGNAGISLDVQTQGTSQKAMVSGLAGVASYEFLDGALLGINIPKMLRGLSIKTLLGWQESSEAKTDFSSLTVSFDIVNGLATTSDLKLVSPLLRVSGKGTTDMPARTLDWRVEPKLVPSLEGQVPVPRSKGEEQELAGLGVPVVVRGPWSNPKIYPDIAGILDDPEAAYKQLKSLGGDLSKILKDGKGSVNKDVLAGAATEAVKRATDGKVEIDVQKVIKGEADDEEVLKAVEEGLGLPSGLLQGFGLGKKKKD